MARFGGDESLVLREATRVCPWLWHNDEPVIGSLRMSESLWRAAILPGGLEWWNG